MKSGYLNADSKAIKLVAYLYQADVESISTRDAAKMMGCETKNVTSLLWGLISRGAMLRTYCADGLHFSLARGVSLEFEMDGRYRYDYPTAEELATGKLDELDEVDLPRQVVVPAVGTPMPVTMGVRSVFELGARMGGL